MIDSLKSNIENGKNNIHVNHLSLKMEDSIKR